MIKFWIKYDFVPLTFNGNWN